MNLKPLKITAPDDSSTGSVNVKCKSTGHRLPYNQAARSGWVADLDGPAFNAYYSPEGVAALTLSNVSP